MILAAGQRKLSVLDIYVYLITTATVPINYTIVYYFYPNYMDSFYQVVENIYKSEPFINYMNPHVLSEFKNIIRSGKFELFNELLTQNRVFLNSDHV